MGIVAGALLGVVCLAALIGYALKKKRSDDDDDISPFDKEEFKRSSHMIMDDDDPIYGNENNSMYGSQHQHQMSEYGLDRSNSSMALPGLARGGSVASPRPPTAIINHYNHQQMMPSFQPGQVVPTMPQPVYNNGQYHSDGSTDLLGGYPISPRMQQHDQMQRQPSNASQWNNGQPHLAHPYQADLSRGPSNASAYSTRSEQPMGAVVGGMRSNNPRSEGHSDEKHLSLVQEEDEMEHHNRSGTPENANVQQYHFSHNNNNNDSISSIHFVAPNNASSVHKSVGTTLPDYSNGLSRAGNENHGVVGGRGENGAWAAGTKNRLSVRNGGRDESDDEDPYGGM